MEFLSEYGLFLAQAVTIVIAIAIVVMLIAGLSQRQRPEGGGQIEVQHLNERYKELSEVVREATLDPAMRKDLLKAERKAEKKADKEKSKEAKKKVKSGAKESDTKPRLYVLDFDGDIRASAVDSLREEVTALLSDPREDDEVLLRLESSGGMVHSYGFASSQLSRIKSKGVSLTVSVDKVAASGGYMMACVANRIIAAPFAIIGSIGVVAQLPNFHKLLKKNDIDFEMFTAGEHKRTVTVFGENTDKGREKFREELEDTHTLFKEFVKENRESVDVDAVATGEVWYGQRAIDRNLVDALETSDDYIQSRLETHGIYSVKYVPRKNWQQRLGMAAESAIERSALKLWSAGAERPKH